LGANDIEFAFRRTLEQMYKFQELNRQLAWKGQYGTSTTL
jgi:hypothetical protein